jgi:hypothetical protein
MTPIAQTPIAQTPIAQTPIAQELIVDPLTNESVQPENDLRMQVRGLLSTLYPKNHPVERRKENRYPFPFLMHLTPIDADGEPSAGETVVVVGRHLSERGLGFYHPKPLPYRRMIVSLESPNGQWLGFLIDLNWCRFTKQGWYESGGRFLRAVPSPIAQEAGT